MKTRKLIVGTVGFFFASLFGFIASLQLSSLHYQSSNLIDHGVQKRSLPFPFKAAFTISSDMDGTRSLVEFLTIQEFLNTKNDTRYGPGLGLEIGNSFFPISPTHPAFNSRNEAEREVITDLIKLGYIDSIHSFNTAKDRSEMLRLTQLLEDCGCRIPVWINHGQVNNNLGAGSTNLGDNPNSSFYHADFSREILGYDFVWEDGVSGIIGQGRPLDVLSFLEIIDGDNVFRSVYENVSKEIAKYLISFFGGRYAGRRNNELIYSVTLDDGQRVFLFVRSNISSQGLGGSTATSNGLADSLRAEVLEKLIRRNGYMIIYTHFGKNNEVEYIPKETREGMKRLAERHREGDLYITTTARLLRYYANNKYLRWHVESVDDSKLIHIDGISDPVRGDFMPSIDDLAGITFYVDNPADSRIFLGGNEITSLVRNPPDHTSRPSVMIPTHPLPPLDHKMLEYKAKGYF